jgi:elongation factor Ts
MANNKTDIELLKKLRERTGLGMLDCKKALEEAKGDIDEAINILRKKGIAIAQKRAEKATTEGVVHSYIHPGEKVGVLVELDCETDFVARTEEFRKFAADIAMHIAAMRPLYVNPEEVDPKIFDREKEIYKEQLANSGKPDKIIDQIVEGKLNKFYKEVCLTKQVFVKNDQKTIEDLLKEMIAKTGENIKIRRFARYEIGA